MIKRFLCFVFILFCCISIYSKDSLYTVINECDIYEYTIKNGYSKTGKITKNDFVKIDYYPYSSSIDFYNNKYFISIVKNNNNFSLFLSDLIPKDTDALIQDELITKVTDDYVWIPSYYLEVIEKKDRELIRKYEKQLVKSYGEPNEYDDGWYGHILQSLIISNSCIDFGHEHLYVENINLLENGFTVETLNYSASKNLNGKQMQKFSFIFDGDFLDVYLEPSETPVYSYFKIKKSDYEKLKSFVFIPREYFLPAFYLNNKTELQKYNDENTIDLSTFKRPERNKKKSQIEEKKFINNVTPNKTMTTNCNLKLRSGEATSTQVLTVMSAGTKVKVLELGKAETIDGINSNWVKVEVQSGAKDRDGKEIKSGTIGWCYGGYLQ